MATGLNITFGVIGTLAIISNCLLLVVIFQNKSMLKTPYNTLVLSLAITDLITGWCRVLHSFLKKQQYLPNFSSLSNSRCVDKKYILLIEISLKSATNIFNATSARVSGLIITSQFTK